MKCRKGFSTESLCQQETVNSQANSETLHFWKGGFGQCQISDILLTMVAHTCTILLQEPKISSRPLKSFKRLLANCSSLTQDLQEWSNRHKFITFEYNVLTYTCSNSCSLLGTAISWHQVIITYFETKGFFEGKKFITTLKSIYLILFTYAKIFFTLWTILVLHVTSQLTVIWGDSGPLRWTPKYMHLWHWIIALNLKGSTYSGHGDWKEGTKSRLCKKS